MKHIFIFLQIIALTGCTSIRNNISDYNVYTVQDELQIGSNYSKMIEEQINLYDDPIVNAYINGIGQKLVSSLHSREIQYVFKVVDDPQINAFAIPGGYCYVNIGLINFAETEEELASVISHEIGHVVGRHGTEKMSKIGTFELLISIFLGPNPSAGSQLITQLASEGLILNYGRKAELEADKLGIEQMHRSGINPNGAVVFFKKLQAKEKSDPSKLQTLMSTHPKTKDRIINAERIIKSLPAKSYISIDSNDISKINQIKNYIKKSSN